MNISAEAADEDDYLLDIKDIAIGPLIGQGQFATVYLGKYFGDYVAVKKQVREAKVLETYLIREISLLQKAKHENLISFFGAYNEVNDDGCEHALYLVTEFCQGGDLLELLINENHHLGWKFRIKIALQAASAINYLHENNFIHRDIKSSNLLIDQDWQCKICDFGMAVEIDPNVSRKMTLCGTAEYMAPELMFDEDSYSFEVDMFSFGMVLLEVLKRCKVGHAGFAERNPRTLFRLDEDSIRSMLPPDSPDSLIALALQCVSDDVPNRPASGDVVDWLQDLCDSTPEDSLAPPVLTPIEWGHAETSRSFGAGEDTVWTAILSADSSGQSRNAPMSPPLTRTLPHPAVSSRIYNDRSPLIKVTPSKHLDSPLSITVTPTRYPDSPLFNTPSAQLPPLSPSTSPCLLDNLPVTPYSVGLEESNWDISREYRDRPDSFRPADEIDRMVPTDMPRRKSRGSLNSSPLRSEVTLSSYFSTPDRAKQDNVGVVSVGSDRTKEGNGTETGMGMSSAFPLIAPTSSSFTASTAHLSPPAHTHGPLLSTERKEIDRHVGTPLTTSTTATAVAVGGVSSISEKKKPGNMEEGGKRDVSCGVVNPEELGPDSRQIPNSCEKNKTAVDSACVPMGITGGGLCTLDSRNIDSTPISSSSSKYAKGMDRDRERDGGRAGKSGDCSPADFMDTSSILDSSHAADSGFVDDSFIGLNISALNDTHNEYVTSVDEETDSHGSSTLNRSHNSALDLSSNTSLANSMSPSNSHSHNLNNSHNAANETRHTNNPGNDPNNNYSCTYSQGSDSLSSPGSGAGSSITAPQNKTRSAFRMTPLTSMNSTQKNRNDADVYYLGILYKKNSTGFFRNWKKVCVTISGSTLKWTSSTDIKSKSYCLTGATVTRTLQYRFQISNMVELRDAGKEQGGGISGSTNSPMGGRDTARKLASREFAAESVPDMDEWVARLESCIEKANSALSPGQGSVTKLPLVKHCTNTNNNNNNVQGNTSVSNITFFASTHKVPHRDRMDVHMTADSATETQSTSSQHEYDERDEKEKMREKEKLKEREREMERGKSTPLTTASSVTAETPLPSPETQFTISKFRIFSSEMTVFTVVASWTGHRSAMSMCYDDFRALHEAMTVSMDESPLLLRHMPSLLSKQDFASTLELFKLWCIGKDESEHATLKGMTDINLKAHLQLQLLRAYIVALGCLVDRTPHLQLLLELLDVLPENLPVTSKTFHNLPIPPTSDCALQRSA